MTSLTYPNTAGILGGRSAEGVLDEVCRQALERVPAARLATVTRERAKNHYVTVVTVGEAGEAWQPPRPGSPSVDVLTGEESCVVSVDLATDARWPDFTAAAERIGARSALAVRLGTDEDGPLGSLTLLSPLPDAFDEAVCARVVPLPVQAGVALSAIHNREQVEHLNRALESNRDIAVAIGIVMAHRVIDRDEGFALLRAASQHLHRKIADLALDVVNTGVLEFPPGAYTQWVKR